MLVGMYQCEQSCPPWQGLAILLSGLVETSQELRFEPGKLVELGGEGGVLS